MFLCIAPLNLLLLSNREGRYDGWHWRVLTSVLSSYQMHHRLASLLYLIIASDYCTVYPPITCRSRI